MRILLQRVSSARVTVDGITAGEIGGGIVLFLGIGREDTGEHAKYLLDKTINLRIFEDEYGRMNHSLADTAGGLLIVSQFTLYADIRRGRRPGFDDAAAPETARVLYDYFVELAKTRLTNVQTGVFQARMAVMLENIGPVTIFHDSIDKYRSQY